MSKNFETVEVDVVDCPDLRKKPFNLASQGGCSSVTVTVVVQSSIGAIILLLIIPLSIGQC